MLSLMALPPHEEAREGQELAIPQDPLVWVLSRLEKEEGHLLSHKEGEWEKGDEGE